MGLQNEETCSTGDTIFAITEGLLTEILNFHLERRRFERVLAYTRQMLESDGNIHFTTASQSLYPDDLDSSIESTTWIWFF